MVKRFIMLSLLIFWTNANALVVPNPAPAAFGPDILGSGYFNPTGPGIISVRISDTGFTLGLGGSEFGMFFQSDSGTLIPIFLPGTQDPDPAGPSSSPPTAAIVLGTGEVYVNGTLQNTFAPRTGPVGFYLAPSPTLQTVFGVNQIFSDPSLNPLGEDMVGTFPIIGVPEAYLLGFAVMDLNDPTSVVPLGYSAVVNLSVPEPGTLALAFLGVAGALMLRRQRRLIPESTAC